MKGLKTDWKQTQTRFVTMLLPAAFANDPLPEHFCSAVGLS